MTEPIHSIVPAAPGWYVGDGDDVGRYIVWHPVIAWHVEVGDSGGLVYRKAVPITADGLGWVYMKYPDGRVLLDLGETSGAMWDSERALVGELYPDPCVMVDK